MRAVLVNHLHPATPHVGGVRLRALAEVLAGRGHHVVLLTGTLRRDDAALPPAEAAARLAAHDWRRPFLLACRPAPAPLLEAMRAGRLGRPLRLALIAGNYALRGGVFPDWTAGSRPYWKLLAKHFRPEVALGTFGNTDAWTIARGIARAAGCPWVMDIKDSWDGFIPAPLRAPLARRFADAAWKTALCQAHLDHGGARFPAPGTVIRSGFPLALLEAPPGPPRPRRLTLTGGLYGEANLAGLLDGIVRWLRGEDAAIRAEAVFTYAGGEHARVAAAARVLDGLCRVDVRPFLPLDELAALHRESFLNLYARAARTADLFHHKLLELLCAGRPVACFPAETAEGERLAAEAGGRLMSCRSAADVAAAAALAWRERVAAPAIDRAALARHSWEAQGERLETVLQGVIGGTK